MERLKLCSSVATNIWRQELRFDPTAQLTPPKYMRNISVDQIATKIERHWRSTGAMYVQDHSIRSDQ